MQFTVSLHKWLNCFVDIWNAVYHYFNMAWLHSRFACYFDRLWFVFSLSFFFLNSIYIFEIGDKTEYQGSKLHARILTLNKLPSISIFKEYAPKSMNKKFYEWFHSKCSTHIYLLVLNRHTRSWRFSCELQSSHMTV